MARLLSPNMEDYLEAAGRLAGPDGSVRVTDLAEAQGVAAPSVVSAVRRLAACGMVEQSRYGRIRITEAGAIYAREVAERHAVLRRFLHSVLCLEAGEAEAEACQLEHAVGDQARDRLVDFVRCLLDCPSHDRSWLESLQARWGERPDPGRGCGKCQWMGSEGGGCEQ